MAAAEGNDPIPVFRNKRRKIEHKRVRLDHDDETLSASAVQSPAAATPRSDNGETAIATPHDAPEDMEDGVPSLKEILRMRKRPQDRKREAARKAVPQPSTSTDLVVAEASRSSDPYATRFVAQTGQVVDKDDKQMMAYIEAKMAEKNYHQYGWPLPQRISTNPFAAIAPPVPKSASAPPAVRERIDADGNPEHEERLTASKGMLQEVNLGTSSWQGESQIRKAKKRTDTAPRNPDSALSGQPQTAKPPKRRRGQKMKTEEELRREAMVEAVMREAKLDFYEEEQKPSTPTTGNGTADEAMLEQFRREYLESIEEQRRPPPPPAGPKGVKEEPKGPKLGGSRSARAAMRLQQEQAAKSKR
ncbi:hypothetical protein BDV96DRAFT_605781 [Lophiotrema nucula]|uniref:Hepatocellular carcinoma-associated antigen 59-domain-containing protein n=1 Tax=Lophiotrema nucula TaxID=690887 RepID=A0A6A5YQE5_9PLEO|nr:hypothetical protein BDV96DRAFT_605781 [Lophiotrema nucula]